MKYLNPEQTIVSNGNGWSGSIEALEFTTWVSEGNTIAPYVLPAITSEDVNTERDRRIATRFTFNGILYDFNMRAKTDITGAGVLAGLAIIAGAQPGDLFWSSEEDEEFGWIAADNTRVLMDAQTCFAFSRAAALHYRRHIEAGRVLKDLDTIPLDFTEDNYWP